MCRTMQDAFAKDVADKFCVCKKTSANLADVFFMLFCLDREFISVLKSFHKERIVYEIY